MSLACPWGQVSEAKWFYTAMIHTCFVCEKAGNTGRAPGRHLQLAWLWSVCLGINTRSKPDQIKGLS